MRERLLPVATISVLGMCDNGCRIRARPAFHHGELGSLALADTMRHRLSLRSGSVAAMFQPNANLTVSWRNDRLYLRTPDCLRVWRGWPHLHAMRREHLGWRSEIPQEFDADDVRLVCAIALRWSDGRYWAAWEQGQAELPLGADVPQHFANAPAWQAFFATFPPDIVGRVGGFLTGHWQCLQVMARVPEAHQLLTSNPNLLWLVAHRHLFVPTLAPLAEAGRLLRLPQRAILVELGFPDVPGLERIVRRVDGCLVTALESAMRLRDALRDLTTAKLLRHYAEDCWRVNLLTDRGLRPWLTAQLLAECERAMTKDWTRWLNGLAGAESASIQPQPIRTMKQLEQWALRIAAACANRTLPVPPLPPRDDQMVALTDVSGLRQEGIEMHHCLATEWLYDYVRQIEAGKRYVYRLASPRMTLAIAKQDNGGWVLSELRGPCNSAARLDVSDGIERWLLEANALRSAPVSQESTPNSDSAGPTGPVSYTR